MNNNSIELRTLARENKDSKQAEYKLIGAVFSAGSDKSNSGPRQRPKSLTEGLSYNLNTKRNSNSEKAMYTTKKTEKKAGIRDWLFGRTSKTQKPKTANLPKPEMGPIVERLQKQSAYLRATLQDNEEIERRPSPIKSQNDQNYSNYDEFTYKNHLLQIHARPTWCDVCEDFIWGIYRSAVRCKCKGEFSNWYIFTLLYN